MTDGLVCGLHVEWHSSLSVFFHLCAEFLPSSHLLCSAQLTQVCAPSDATVVSMLTLFSRRASLSFPGYSPLPNLLHHCLTSIQPPTSHPASSIIKSMGTPLIFTSLVTRILSFFTQYQWMGRAGRRIGYYRAIGYLYHGYVGVDYSII
jgi:hypothetical protein